MKKQQPQCKSVSEGYRCERPLGHKGKHRAYNIQWKPRPKPQASYPVAPE